MEEGGMKLELRYIPLDDHGRMCNLSGVDLSTREWPVAPRVGECVYLGRYERAKLSGIIDSPYLYVAFVQHDFDMSEPYCQVHLTDGKPVTQ
jgi:hypothetical protein